ncbi:MAG: cell division protein FtsQ/DivIB [Chakrabartia sp.]
MSSNKAKSTATIKRGGAKRPTVKTRARKTSAKPSVLSRMIARIPLKPATIERAMTAATVVMVGGAVLGVAMLAGVPTYIGTEFAQIAGRAGFQVKRVEVKGLDRMESLTVYAVALDQHSMAMPLVDLDKVRNQLLQYGWIADARVSRRLPDTLVVDVVERTPAAVWQNNQKLSLIDGEGVVLERVDAAAMPDLPLIIGQNANKQVADLTQLIDTVPALKPTLAGATWVGNRRWDLRFQSGETLALPEGEDIAAIALSKFARIDGMERLLGRGFVRFDMRDPSKFVVRVSRGQGRVDVPKTL